MGWHPKILLFVAGHTLIEQVPNTNYLITTIYNRLEEVSSFEIINITRNSMINVLSFGQVKGGKI